MAEAAAMHRPASQLIRELVSEFVAQRRAGREHDAWFRAAVEEGLRQADDPSVARIPHDEIAAEWRVQREELAKQASKRQVRSFSGCRSLPGTVQLKSITFRSGTRRRPSTWEKRSSGR
jgi:predicted transcriptional regulator